MEEKLAYQSLCSRILCLILTVNWFDNNCLLYHIVTLNHLWFGLVQIGLEEAPAPLLLLAAARDGRRRYHRPR